MGYHLLCQMKQGIVKDSESDLTGDRMEAIIPTKLEQMVKKFKAHECTLDFDHRFCKAIFKEDLPGDSTFALALIYYYCSSLLLLIAFVVR